MFTIAIRRFDRAMLLIGFAGIAVGRAPILSLGHLYPALCSESPAGARDLVPEAPIIALRTDRQPYLPPLAGRLATTTVSNGGDAGCAGSSVGLSRRYCQSAG
jgi:hypothetical protein